MALIPYLRPSALIGAGIVLPLPSRVAAQDYDLTLQKHFQGIATLDLVPCCDQHPRWFTAQSLWVSSLNLLKSESRLDCMSASPSNYPTEDPNGWAPSVTMVHDGAIGWLTANESNLPADSASAVEPAIQGIWPLPCASN